MAHIVEMGDGKLLGKLPALGAQLSGLDVLAGGGVVSTMAIFPRSNTEVRPAFSNSVMATGVVMSLPNTRSSFPSMS